MPLSSDDTVIVTGGTSGIGLAITDYLLEAGKTVVAVDIKRPDKFDNRLERWGDQLVYEDADVTDEQAMDRMAASYTVDALINNAGYYSPLVTDKKRFDEISLDEWRRVMDVNTTGVFISSKAVLPHLRENGSIVNIASSTIVKGTTGFLHYVASKTAVVGMTRAMANELGDLNIRVNAVMPGFTASEASKQAGEEYVQNRVDSQAIKRPVHPEDIANAVGFLASEKSNKISGQVVTVDGGSIHY